MTTSRSNLLESIGLLPGMLEDWVAVVTGGGQGIGREIAITLASLGARVGIAELSEFGLETARQIQGFGGAAKYVQTDISQQDPVNLLAKQIHEELGPVDILINNAIRCPVAPVVEMDLSQWDEVVAVNLRGAFLTCKAFLPEMIARKHGIILNMISTDAMPGLSAYIATKQGLAGFSQSLAVEVGAEGVRVVAFAPGMVDTPGIRSVADRLAPLLGMTVEEFMRISLHPAYDGLMPVEHAAAAAAYLAVNCAEEYHGEIVNGYEILEKAGLIQAKGIELVEQIRLDGAGEIESSGLDQDEQCSRALAYSRKLQIILDETASEFNQLPVFIRPMARSGFKSKAGLRLQDWQRMVESLAAQLSLIQAGETTGKINIPQIQDLLEKLSVYYQGVPAETARFTKDTEFLEEVARRTAQRVSVIKGLVRMLEETGFGA